MRLKCAPFRNQTLYRQLQLECPTTSAAHTLNLVATTDAGKGLKTPGLSKLNNATMGKCSALWTAAGRPKSSEIIKEILGKDLRYPCVTRWNSLYDSLVQLDDNKSELNKLMTSLKLPTFKSIELEFIQEYTVVMKPIAVALDKLQEESNCYYGTLIPTLLVTQRSLKTNNVNDLRMRHCGPLLSAVVSGFKRRFEKYLNLEAEITDAVLATVSHPFFKLRWISLLDAPEFENKEKTKADISSRLQLATRKFSHNNTGQQDSANESGDDLFFNMLEGCSTAPHNQEDLEVLNFFRDPNKSLSSLRSYPTIEKIFKHYNTPLPSSAPVERLFSFAGMVNSPRRMRLADSKFEQLVLLKANAGI